jgi:cell division protein FtsL
MTAAIIILIIVTAFLLIVIYNTFFKNEKQIHIEREITEKEIEIAGHQKTIDNIKKEITRIENEKKTDRSIDDIVDSIRKHL